jgi:ubiquitin-conjugating enzyme E2 Q
MNVAAKRRHSNEDEEVSQPLSSLPTGSTAVVRVESGFSSAARRAWEEDLELCSVIAAPPANIQDGTILGTEDTSSSPNHIPVVESFGVSAGSTAIVVSSNNVEVEEDDVPNDFSGWKTMSHQVVIGNVTGAGTQEDDGIDDESDYEYEDEDDVAFSGFLMSSDAMVPTNPPAALSTAPARIEEDFATAAATSLSPSNEPSIVAESSLPDAGEIEAPPRKKWREPTREAVNMSLRAQQETSGSKRRLAQDLYRIMNQDTEEAGFSLAPKSEDSMELWTINLFQFDPDSNLAKDMMVLGINHIELEMKFPEQYPFEPPFVRVVKPRFKRQTGFVMNGALCAELLTKEGWNPINDIESVIVSIRSLLVVGDGRLQAAVEIPEARYSSRLKAAQEEKAPPEDGEPQLKKARFNDEIGSYTAAEAQSAYSHLSDYHKKKGWDTSGWWARKG